MRSKFALVGCYLIKVREATEYIHVDDMAFYVTQTKTNEVAMFGIARVGKGNFFRIGSSIAESDYMITTFLQTINSMVKELRNVH